MSDLLVAVILSVCPLSVDGGTTDCMERVNNCAIESQTMITEKSIHKCLEQHEKEKIK